MIEWDPVDKLAYGLVGGSNMLFKFDPAAGREIRRLLDELEGGAS